VVIVQFGGQTPLNLASRSKPQAPHYWSNSPNPSTWPKTAAVGKLLDEIKSRKPPEHGHFPRKRRSSRRGKSVRYGESQHVLAAAPCVIRLRRRNHSSYMREAASTRTKNRPTSSTNPGRRPLKSTSTLFSDGEAIRSIGGIHAAIEKAGIHSGDSSCVLPAVDIPQPRY